MDATQLLAGLAVACVWATTLFLAFLAGLVPAGLALRRWWEVNLAQRAALFSEIQTRYLAAVERQVAAEAMCRHGRSSSGGHDPDDDDDDDGHSV